MAKTKKNRHLFLIKVPASQPASQQQPLPFLKLGFFFISFFLFPVWKERFSISFPSLLCALNLCAEGRAGIRQGRGSRKNISRAFSKDIMSTSNCLSFQYALCIQEIPINIRCNRTKKWEYIFQKLFLYIALGAKGQ